MQIQSDSTNGFIDFKNSTVNIQKAVPSVNLLVEHKTHNTDAKEEEGKQAGGDGSGGRRFVARLHEQYIRIMRNQNSVFR